MPVDINLIIGLSFLFFIVAFVYSSVGLGGGSSYTALMSVFKVSTLAIPMVSLVLNLSVTLMGSYNFIRHKHAKIRIVLPFLITSIPAAYLGGSFKLSPKMFQGILLASLVVVVLRIFFWKKTSFQLNLDPQAKIIVSLTIGAGLGLIAGIVGIGGGIYLVPAIIILNLGTEKEAGACGTIFIWINSLVGLLSRLRYNSIDIGDYLLLILAVILGGFIGSLMGSTRFSPRTMERILGGVILVAIVFLIPSLFLEN